MLQGSEPDVDDGLLVVEAPLMEGSVPSTPVDDTGTNKQLGKGRLAIDVVREHDGLVPDHISTGTGSGSSSEKAGVEGVT